MRTKILETDRWYARGVFLLVALKVYMFSVRMVAVSFDPRKGLVDTRLLPDCPLARSPWQGRAIRDRRRRGGDDACP